MTKRLCLQCGRECIKREQIKFCSRLCSGINRIGKHTSKFGTGKKKGISCILCKRKLIVSDTKINLFRKFCSKKCELKIAKERIRIVGLANKRFETGEEKRIAALANGRKSYRKNIEKRLIYYRQLSFIRRGATGKYSSKEWEDLKKKHNHSCNICKRKEPEIKLTVDHIIPISKWKEWIKNHRVKYLCNNIENIQPLCKSCNSRKRDKCAGE